MKTAIANTTNSIFVCLLSCVRLMACYFCLLICIIAYLLAFGIFGRKHCRAGDTNSLVRLTMNTNCYSGIVGIFGSDVDDSDSDA